MKSTILPDDLKSIPLFRRLKPEQLGWIWERLHYRTFAESAPIALAEQPGEAVYIILNGAVKVYVDQLNGSDVILAILGAGDVVGEMSLLGENPSRSANITALVDSDMAWTDRGTLVTCIDSMPGLVHSLLDILSDRLRQANEQNQSLATLDVRGRVARQLLLLAQKFGVPDDQGNVTIHLPISQRDLGTLVGASRERVNQILSECRRNSILETDRAGNLIIRDRTTLHSWCVGYIPVLARTVRIQPQPSTFDPSPKPNATQRQRLDSSGDPSNHLWQRF